MKKNCELCKLPARTFCESDNASLCWDCDSKVHSANFLVERHTRNLLCHACHSHTQWKSSGARLGNAISLCESCAGGTETDGGEEDDESEGDNEVNDEVDTDDDEEDGDEGGDEDGDNQVVPWSSSAMPPPAASSCSNSDESVSKFNDEEVVSKLVTTVSLKRRREDHDFQGSDLRNQRRTVVDGVDAALSGGERTEHFQPQD